MEQLVADRRRRAGARVLHAQQPAAVGACGQVPPTPAAERPRRSRPRPRRCGPGSSQADAATPGRLEAPAAPPAATNSNSTPAWRHDGRTRPNTSSTNAAASTGRRTAGRRRLDRKELPQIRLHQAELPQGHLQRFVGRAARAIAAVQLDGHPAARGRVPQLVGHRGPKLAQRLQPLAAANLSLVIGQLRRHAVDRLRQIAQLVVVPGNRHRREIAAGDARRPRRQPDESDARTAAPARWRSPPPLRRQPLRPSAPDKRPDGSARSIHLRDRE